MSTLCIDPTENKVYVGEIGKTIDLYTGTDISSADSVSIEAQKPSGATASWTGSVYEDYYVQYSTVDGDLDESGLWKLQAKITIGTNVFFGNTVDMHVYAVFT